MDTPQTESTASAKKAPTPALANPGMEALAPALQASPAAALQRVAMPSPTPGSNAADVLALQSTVGNRAVNHLLAQRKIQAKLTVGPANDRYEQEAERVADQVMAAPTQVVTAPTPTAPSAQRAVIQRKFSADHAKAFVAANLGLRDDQWPAQKPANFWTWFRARPGVVNALRQDPRWENDQEGQPESQAEIVNQLENRWATIEAERRRLAEAEELRLAKEDAAQRVTADLRRHVFKGDFKAGTETPTGFHSIVGESATHKPYGTKTEVDADLGIYQQSVKGKKSNTWVKKANQSTFFPDTIDGRDTTVDDVILALGTAMASQNKLVKFPLAWRGMGIKKLGETWFPTGGNDELLAE